MGRAEPLQRLPAQRVEGSLTPSRPTPPPGRPEAALQPSVGLRVAESQAVAQADQAALEAVQAPQSRTGADRVRESLARIAADRAEMQAIRASRPAMPPAAEPKSLFNALPAHVRAAGGGGTKHDPIKRHVVHQVDIRPIPRSRLPNFDHLMPRVRAAIARRQKGDPLRASIETVAAKVLYFFRTQRTGFMQATYKAIAEAKCCIDTAFLVVRFLELHGILGIEGTRVREEETGDFHRGPNLYVFRDDEPPPPPPDATKQPAEPAEPDAIPHWLRRYANAVSLYVRPLGLNTTPLKAAPAPA